MAMATQAQESKEVYSFLRLPISAHAAALGGDNISLTDDDPTVVFHNPALITGVTDKSLNLNFMTYMEGAKTASASFVKTYKERASWAVSARYMDYGSIKETTVSNEEMGTFSPKDIALAGSFAYLLADHFSGAITARFISSTIGSYNSAAVAIDLGANYIDEERGWSVSAVARNLGGQIKAYHDRELRRTRRTFLLVFAAGLVLGGAFAAFLILHPVRMPDTVTVLESPWFWPVAIAGTLLAVGCPMLLTRRLFTARFRR